MNILLAVFWITFGSLHATAQEPLPGQKVDPIEECRKGGFDDGFNCRDYDAYYWGCADGAKRENAYSMGLFKGEHAHFVATGDYCPN